MTLVHILYSGLGGHFSVVFSLIEADKERLYKYVVMFYGIEEMPQSYLDKCEELQIEYHFIKKKVGIDLPSQRKVSKILKSIRADIIILHTVSLIVPVSVYAISSKTKLISLEHQPNHLKLKKEWVWSVLVMRLSTQVVYLTELYAKQMKKHLGMLYINKKVTVINNGINTDLFKPRPASSKENRTIGMLARLSGTKDHLTLVEAFGVLRDKDKSYHDITLKIAGDGDMRPAIMKKVEELDLLQSVEFLGMVPEYLSPVFLNELTIYVHASLGETMSTSIMQVMACGKAIIASDVEGINNMIKPGYTGILVPALDKHKLADEMARLLADSNLQDRLGKNALFHAHYTFSNEHMFESYKKLFVR